MGTIKVATLIFISGRGSVISTAQEWKSGSIYESVVAQWLGTCLWC